ncbi:MAG: hypothetical protein PWQ57_2174 [Desulfovibrionales bacterium]|nr:hypothetical protein [Desulfovibrionales bacterium]
MPWSTPRVLPLLLARLTENHIFVRRPAVAWRFLPEEIQPVTPQKIYLLIFNLGDGSGVFARKRLVFGGNLAFKIKNYIEASFMRRFQKICGTPAI